MDIFSVLSVITDVTKVFVPTHCEGFADNPPILSGATNLDCNAPTGCKRNTTSSFGAHHKCASKTLIYCECSRNTDREEGKVIKHYFIRLSKDISHYNICNKCQKDCGVE